MQRVGVRRHAAAALLAATVTFLTWSPSRRSSQDAFVGVSVKDALLPTATGLARLAHLRRLRPVTPPRRAFTDDNLAGPSPTAIVICPAQFSVRADYDTMIQELREVTGIEYIEVVDLQRTDWLRIIPATITNLGAYINGALPIRPTLDFYIERLDEAVAAARGALGEKARITLVGHSIGGWVARGFLAERPEIVPIVDVLATLGSPNQPPPKDSVWASFDQTRGLLRECNERFAGLENKPRLLSVAGRGTVGGLLKEGAGESGLRDAWDESVGRSPLLEGVVASSSYLALSGDAFTVGDGLIPVSAAAMEGSDVIELEDCNHAGFVPSAGESLLLPDTYKWYGSRDMVDKWAPKLLSSS